MDHDNNKNQQNIVVDDGKPGLVNAFSTEDISIRSLTNTEINDSTHSSSVVLSRPKSNRNIMIEAPITEVGKREVGGGGFR